MKRKITAVISLIFALAMMFTQVLPVFAAEGRLLYTDIDTFTDAEQEEISGYLYDLSEENECDLVCLCISSFETYENGRYTEDTIENIAADYYSEYDIGRGANSDAVIAVWVAGIGSEINELHISTFGEKYDHDDALCIYDEYFNNYPPDSSDSDESEYYLKCMALADGFETVSGDQEYVIESDDNGFVISRTEDYEPQNDFEWAKYIVIALVIGAVIGFIIATVMKSKLKSVRRQPGAANYVVGGSFKVEKSSDVFLYKKVDKTAKPKQQPPKK